MTLPDLRRGESLTRLVEGCYQRAGAKAGEIFLHANVLLTLADCRGETCVPISDLAPADVDNLLAVNELLAPHRIGIHTTPRRELLVLFSEAGLSRTTAQSSLAGIQPSSGNPRWRSLTCASLQAEGYYDWTMVLSGVLHGYPDQAVLDFDEWLRSGRRLALEAAPIWGVDTYPCAQPVFDYFPHHRQDPDIRGICELWSEVLKEFYLGAWHRGLKEF